MFFKKKKKKKKSKKDKVKSKIVFEDDFDLDEEGLEFLDWFMEEDKMGELRKRVSLLVGGMFEEKKEKMRE